jgi:hypothetical protein
MLLEDVAPPPLAVLTLRVTVRSPAALDMPHMLGVALRGTLGKVLKQGYCEPAARAGQAAPHAAGCPYCAVFAPVAPVDRAVLSPQRDPPRPYVVRPPLARHAWCRPGDPITWTLVLAGSARNYLPYILAAFVAAGGVDLGQGRGTAPLDRVETVDPLDGACRPLFAEGRVVAGAFSTSGLGQWQRLQRMLQEPGVIRALEVPEVITPWWHEDGVYMTLGAQVFAAALRQAPDIEVRFLSLMRLKHERLWARTPSCRILVVNALRRVSGLCAFFGTGPWAVAVEKTGRDEVLALADQVPVRQINVQWENWARTSGATGQRMPLDGFTGRAVYGEVPAIIRAILLAGSLVHIGDDVVFGNGAYEARSLAPDGAGVRGNGSRSR